MRQQEEALRLSENRFSVAINASGGTLFEVDMEKNLSYIRKATRPAIPLNKSNRGETENLEISSPNGKIHLQAYFSFIKWSQNQRMLLLFGTEDAIEKT